MLISQSVFELELLFAQYIFLFLPISEAMYNNLPQHTGAGLYVFLSDSAGGIFLGEILF